MTLTNSSEKLSGRTKQGKLPNQILFYLKDEVVWKEKGDVGVRKDRSMKQNKNLRNKPKEEWELILW